MHEMIADNVSLVFPLYGGAQSSRLNGELSKPRNDRVIISPKGQIVGVRALVSISFALKSGDRLGIVGSNGAGKTTLLQTLAGIFSPDEGQVTVRGKTTNLINVSLGMRPDATGARNILLCGLAAGHSRDAIEARREQVMAFADLGDFISMPVSTYSSGMRMRLSFAIATAFDPEILILDEWLGAGDAVFQRKAAERMNVFVENAGILVLASHSRTLLERNCNKGLWLDEGRVRAFGDISDAIDQYEAASAARA